MPSLVKKAPGKTEATLIPAGQAMPHIRWRLKHPEPEEVIEYIEIDPDTAEAILQEYNSHNRRLNERRVDLLAGFMIRDVWYPATNIVGFAEDGYLINAQHTLTAIVDSKRTQRMICAFNLNPDTQAVFDTQSKRTLGQALGLEGEGNPSDMAPVLKVIYQVENNNGTPSHWVPEPTSVEYSQMVNDEVREAVDVAKRINKATGGRAPVSVVGAAFYYCLPEDPVKAREFFEQIELGGVPGDHPAAQVRTRLNDRKSRGSMSRGEQAMYYDLIVRGFIKSLSGDTSKIYARTPGRWLVP